MPIVAELDLRTLLERHVELFNDAVVSSEFDPLRWGPLPIDAVMIFDDVPLGPFKRAGRDRRGVRERTATDTMALIDMEEIGDDAVRASFEWDAGGTGQMFLRWVDGEVVELRIAASSADVRPACRGGSGEAAAGHGRRAVAPDRGDHVEHLRGSGAPGGPGTPGPPARPRPRSRPACRSSRSSTGRSSVSPTKSLLDRATSTGQPVADQLVQPAGELQRVPGVLAEVVRRVDQDAVRAYAQAPPPGRRAR